MGGGGILTFALVHQPSFGRFGVVVKLCGVRHDVRVPRWGGGKRRGTKQHATMAGHQQQAM